MVITIIQNEDRSFTVIKSVPEKGWSQAWKTRTTEALLSTVKSASEE